jgi:hypothetical protein
MVRKKDLAYTKREIRRLKKRVAELGEGYFDIDFVKWRLSCMKNQAIFFERVLAEQAEQKEKNAIGNWLNDK